MLHNQLVKLVPEVVSTGGPTVAIIDSKERAAGPVSGLLEFRLDDVEYNRDSILIVISNDTLVGVCCVRSHNTVALACKLCWLIRLDKGDD